MNEESQEMNILKQDRKRSVNRKVDWDCLDDRIVPSTVQLNLAAAAGAAAAHAHASVSVNATTSAEASATTETPAQTRRENRIVKLEERREAAKERREVRLEKLAAAHRFSPAVMNETPAAFAAAMARARESGHGSVSSGGGTGGSGTGSTSTGTTVTIPVTTSPIPSAPVTTSPGSGSGSTGTGTTSTNPLPDNVAAVLDTVYEEFQNGTLPTSSQPGQVEIQGSNVGVQIHVSNSADFSSVLSQAQSLGLQVTTSSAAYDLIDGFLPIAQLPAAAQLSGAPSIDAQYVANLN
jgi:hypothetical protein